ncbi:conserved hypothetical protein [Culex quinquefasciatus]|uniref:Uncharacterized protein n=1 Tax=Culex quinquefasciatus TaxID=7176 RepID=B0W9G9_CULQU|nr:conserved hypothetical protein [Culex quinquefasciatus]|eukprot:XP_001845353.1 conserved hypothetical protein [Culex quinquefasciatus]
MEATEFFTTNCGSAVSKSWRCRRCAGRGRITESTVEEDGKGVDPPTLEEVAKAVKELKNGKSTDFRPNFSCG